MVQSFGTPFLPLCFSCCRWKNMPVSMLDLVLNQAFMSRFWREFSVIRGRLSASPACIIHLQLVKERRQCADKCQHFFRAHYKVKPKINLLLFSSTLGHSSMPGICIKNNSSVYSLKMSYRVLTATASFLGKRFATTIYYLAAKKKVNS